MALAVLASENSTYAQELAGVNVGTLDGIDAVLNQNWDGLLCALGIFVTPIVGTVYGVTRCLFKTNASDVWACIGEDIKVTLTAFAAAVIGLCWIDPLGYPTLP